MKVIIIIASISLIACANSSGVTKTGNNTFTISTSASPGRGGVPAAKRIAYEAANKKCSSHGLELFTLSEKTSSPTWTEGMANMELTFRCLRSSDPQFQDKR
jgi:hypothetical protein